MIIRIVSSEISADGKEKTVCSVNGVGEYNKSQTGAVAVAETVKELVEKEGLTLQQAVDRINEIKPEGKFVIASAEKGFFEDKRCKDAEVVTSKGTFTVYVNNQWTPKKFGNFMLGMNEKFNNIAEKEERVADEKKGGYFSKVKSIFGLGDTAEETKPAAKADDAAEKAAAEKAKLEAEKAAAEKAKAEAEKKKAEAEKAAAEKAQAEAEKAKLEAEKAALEKLKAETEKAKAELAAAEKMKAELEKAKAEAEKAKAAAEKAQAEASATAESGTSKKKDPFFADMVKVEGTFTDFYISKYPVTQAQWFAVMGNNPSKFQSNNNPVEQVSWEDCQLFLKKLNELTGKKYRLPTSGEWQFAASGGQKSKNFKYAGSNDIKEVAWYGGSTHPVGQKQPNELGLYDMSGNVDEWCEDWSDEKKTSRVTRGGSWCSTASCFEVSHRGSAAPSTRYDSLGFRLAL